MRKFFNIFIAVLTVAVFSSAPVFSSDTSPNGEEMITGILVKVETKKLAVYVRENSRIVKFKATIEICEKFKNKINSEVDIKYIIRNKKVLQITSMTLSEKKEGSKEEPVKP